MEYQEISNTEIISGSPVDTLLLSKIRDNISYLNEKEEPSDLILEVVSSDSLTFNEGHRNLLVSFDSIEAGVFTIPSNVLAPFLIGTQISFAQIGAGELRIAAGPGVTIHTEVGLRLSSINAMGSALKVDANAWRLTGSLKG